MPKLTTLAPSDPWTIRQQILVKNLALAYEGFANACRGLNLDDSVMWGERLLVAQGATGVVMFKPELIRKVVDEAKEKLAALEAEEPPEPALTVIDGGKGKEPSDG